jgi:hypothetical protein
MLSKIPGRVAAPLLGHVYRAALGPNPWVLVLVGSAGSYKTSIASLAMHHYGELWDRRKPASSMSGNGDTLNALRIKLNAAKDSLYWADDVAPTRDWAAAQKMLEEFARLVHNGEQRSRSTRDGLSVLDGTPPRSSALVTSEVMPRPGSGAQRMLVVPLQAEAIELENLIALDDSESRHARAVLMASMLSWLAKDLGAARRKYLAEASRYAKDLVAAGESDRLSEAVGNAWAGWCAMTEFLFELDVISDDERDQVLDRVDGYLHDAVEATKDPDMPSRTGARIRELLTHALHSGLAYVDDVRTGDAPPWPLAGQLGWRRTSMGEDQHGVPRYRIESKGIRFGYVLHDPLPKEGVPQLLVTSVALEQVLKATASTMADSMQIDRGTAVRALMDEGVLIAEECRGKLPRPTVQRTLHCEGRRSRVTALRLRELLGIDPDSGTVPFDDGPDPTPDDQGPSDNEAPLPDLFTTPPTIDSLQRSDIASTAPTPEGPTSPLPEENSVPSFTDAEGTPAVGHRIQPLHPCLLCGQPCAMKFLDDVLHMMCWTGSTAATRAAARDATRALNEAAANQTAAAATEIAQKPTQSATASTNPPVQTTASPYAAPAAVLDTDGIWMPNGERSDAPRPIRHVGDIADMVSHFQLGTKVTSWRDEPGQIWVTAEALNSFGIDSAELPDDPGKRVAAIRDLTRGNPFLTDAIAEGWKIGGKTGDCLGAWTRIWRGDKRGVWIALIPAMDGDIKATPVLGDSPNPATLSRRLALFASALQAPWALSGSTTGLDLMISLRSKDKDKYFTPLQPVPPALDHTLERELNWSRVPTDEEQKMHFIHAYDRGGSYAAGCAGLELGIGQPVHHPEGATFDPKLPGYWKYEVPEAADWRFPHPLKPRGGMPTRPVWGTTPGVQLAYELGYEVEILEAYTWPEHGRILDPWYARIRDARTALDINDHDSQLARDLLKVVYTRTIGMLGSDIFMKDRPGYAPDRRHHIVSKARTNVLRRILQIGRDTDTWPVAATADTILYLSNEGDPTAAWPGKPANFGRGFGQFKPEASGLLIDQLPYLNGKDYRGKDDLKADSGNSESRQEAAE